MEDVVQRLLKSLILDREKLDGMIEGIKLLYTELRKEQDARETKDSISNGDAEESKPTEAKALPHD